MVPEFLSSFTLWFGLLINISRNTENFKCGDSGLKGYEISFSLRKPNTGCRMCGTEEKFLKRIRRRVISLA